MPDSIVKQLVDSYRTLTSTTNAYQGERGATMALPCVCFRAYGGRASQEIPTQDLRVQAVAYAETQEGADALAEAVRTALHGKRQWDVGGYWVGSINCDPVVFLPSQPATGKQTFRAAVSMRVQLRPDH